MKLFWGHAPNASIRARRPDAGFRADGKERDRRLEAFLAHLPEITKEDRKFESRARAKRRSSRGGRLERASHGEEGTTGRAMKTRSHHPPGTHAAQGLIQSSMSRAFPRHESRPDLRSYRVKFLSAGPAMAWQARGHHPGASPITAAFAGRR
jgi:hypothetical protein